MAGDPEAGNIVRTFNEAIAILDASEGPMRDLIEHGLMDTAGINKTRIGDARLTLEQVSMDVIEIRINAIKEAFRYLRANLPADI